MGDVISLAEFKASKEQPVKVAHKRRKSGIGLGVVIRPPGCSVAAGVLGGNAPVAGPAAVLFHEDADLFKIGNEIRRRMKITLEPQNDPDPEPPRAA